LSIETEREDSKEATNKINDLEPKNGGNMKKKVCNSFRFGILQKEILSDGP
jgi:hypothetical protein